ncbi:glycosyltransferase [Limibaculum sp. FT325]|uniref:glycosyltransferase n=1 Tax=Thermohalobaculum sediminis TaxID=2939436 RepID=UPI0020BE9338|nr:glycosyltransferase [Limibaculum sediminis]MCL5778962.1 glycosyltransferase [Limibaculum sediminis]
MIEIHSDIWSGIEDKSQVKGLGAKLKSLLTWIGSYPRLVLRYSRAPEHDAVVVGYLGHLDVLILWPLARLKGKPIVWDAFLSLYDTIVQDRKLVGPGHPIAWFVWAWEWLACRASTRVVLDTAAHAALFTGLYRLPARRTAVALVGAETLSFDREAAQGAGVAIQRPSAGDELTILFYGQFIPLHGIDTIVRAAQRAIGRPYRWVLIGRGQEEARIRALIDTGPRLNLEWISWVPYGDLINWITGSDLCLGIFGDTGKASRVIPNKVFQILSAGQPLVTRDSPAIRELLSEPIPGVYLVPPADPQALLDAIERFRADRSAIAAAGGELHATARERFALPALGAAWLSILQEVGREPAEA